MAILNDSIHKYKKTISEGYSMLEKYVGIKLSDILTPSQISELKSSNKGACGQIIEKITGLSLSSDLTDFSDGEMKSNKCNKDGKPLETIAITQFSNPDFLFEKKPFYTTKLYEKLRHVLLVFVSKDGPPEDWFIHSIKEVNLSEPKYSHILKQIENDYIKICNDALTMVTKSSNSMLHTLNGQYIQIRTKDSKPYKPIYSEFFGRIVSDKRRAFFFKKEFLKEIQKIC